MSILKFYSTETLLFLWVLPFLCAAFFYARHQRKKALKVFIESDLLPQINSSISYTRRYWKAAMIVFAFVMIVIAAARPAWNPVPKKLAQKGRDVVFVLDVSKSMLAEDLRPSRLERSKLAILDTIDRLQGDRVGLVVFAGNAVVKCPLTLDYGFFRMMVEGISVASISRGGTMIGDALRKALDEAFDKQDKKFKDIILITDGEDHDSFPVQAAEEAGERGVRLIVIGIGDENEGQRIPISDDSGKKGFLTYKGQEVWSKLDADTLRKMVNATPGGKYLNVATGTIDLGEVYLQLIASAEKRDLESRTVKLYEEKYQIFLGFAFLLLCGELILSERKKGA